MTEEITNLNFQITGAEAGRRLDAFLVERIENWSRSRLQKLIDDGDVMVNEKPSKSSYKLRPGDEIEVELAELPVAEFVPENIALEVVYDDEY